jgi:hypothetical protein
MAAKTAAARRNAALDTAFDTLNNGKLGILDGAQPTNADTALGAQVLLAELALGATAFAAASAGSKTANSITQDSSANASGTPGWASLYASTTATRHLDMSAGTSGTDMILNASPISSGAVVSCSSLVISQAA